MAAREIETAAVLWGDRYAPIEGITAQAQAFEASGVFDAMVMSDQLGNFFPPSLWTPENSPMAALLPDPDSVDDPWVSTAFAKAAAPGLDVAIATDAVRHGPAQLIRTMLTIARMNEGRAKFHIGAGEIKQCKPYGWKRSQGLKRLDDLVQIFNLLWDTDGPIDFEGHHWTLERATLGGAKQHKPQIWLMGGGPKLMDLATSYCDGLTGAAPLTWPSPEVCAERVATLRADLERKGRDPDEFGFGTFSPVLLHDDAAAIDKALDNTLVRWLTGIIGRLNPADWANEGLESPVPEGWTYHMKMLPQSTDQAFIDEVLAKTTRAHAEASFLYGTPEQVAEQAQAYIDAGVTWIAPVDYMGLLGGPEDALGSMQRNIELCGLLKAR